MENSPEQSLSLNKFNILLEQAGIIDSSYPLSAIIWLPDGYKILNIAEQYLNILFEKYNYKRHIFPFLVSSKEFDHINDNICSFEKGIYKVTESIILRPSGESAIYPMFRKWIKTYNDLPLKVFQIGSIFRRGSTRGFMRSNENDFFIEAHAAFSSREEVERELSSCNDMVNDFMKWLAIPTLKTIRPPWTNKPVAETEYAFDVFLPTKETALLNVTYTQMQIFSKIFNITFTNKNGIKDFTYQIEFGFSQRCILISIWLLSNENNLFMLPIYSPIQIVIFQIDSPIIELNEYVDKIANILKGSNIRIEVDKKSGQLYKRFGKYEKLGVPIRFEIGKKELDSEIIKIVRQDNKKALFISLNNIIPEIDKLFLEISSEALMNNEKNLIENTIYCTKTEDIKNLINSGKIAKIHLCFSEDCVKNIEKNVRSGEIVGFEYINKNGGDLGKCVNCQKPTSEIAYYSRRI
ncbi:MAG: His/Gly/Thr/Pro-type tRNA ligase C-terminal domain-containing protein [Candidatus Gracilibacteria bacterium]|nr:His/Gly/Thr/Pro-type tRNA ligase C-terminal domain-containing protein [Candidatus Gracilibacteria bacterium]MDD3119807.1 His/Gly/Thr/Pro-type tRNA ligase C-terminal domain-containing protein [Candidatus Gracilibacteria bacterium]MDD4530368.1 His/Gly/Thr/Pro-type tRNA ligase C-terminal domain-containing protein [Candidatus Gracilibacteria bacterium]